MAELEDVCRRSFTVVDELPKQTSVESQKKDSKLRKPTDDGKEGTEEEEVNYEEKKSC